MTVITDKKAFEKAVPILASDAKRLPKLLESLTPAERRWAEAAGFDGAPQQLRARCPTPRAASRACSPACATPTTRGRSRRCR